MIAERDRIDPRGEQLVGDLGSYPEAAGDVLGVDDNEGRRVALAQDGQALEQRAPTHATDNISDEKDARPRAYPPRPRTLLIGTPPALRRACQGRLVLSHTLAMVAGEKSGASEKTPEAAPPDEGRSGS